MSRWIIIAISIVVSLAAFGIIQILGNGSSTTHAGAVFVVTKTDDTNDGSCDADCSLREAVIAANAAPGPDMITLPAGTYTLTIAGDDEDAGATGDLDSTDDLTIDGDGSGTTTIDAGGLDRVIQTSGTLEISGVTLTGGDTSLASDDQGGGIAIFCCAPGTIILNDSAVVGNTSGDQGAGIWTCCDDAVITLTNSTVSNNTGGDQGGGIFHCCGDLTLTVTDSDISNNFGDDQGGGIFFCCGDEPGTPTTITILRSTISGNTSTDQGGGIFYCCGGSETDEITITDSTISGNTAASEGGGIYVCCEAVGGTTTTVTNSTISGNEAGLDGGGIYSDATLSLTNATIAGNTALSSDTGGGVFNDGGTATIQNTIIAGNVDEGGTAPDCGGDEFTSMGHNLILDTTGCTIGGDTTGNITGEDPTLGPLADNGGTTETHALLEGSPAIDTADDDACPAADQRGVARPQDGDEDGTAVCDIGAFEFAIALPTPTNTPGGAGPTATPGGPAATATVAVTELPVTGAESAEGPARQTLLLTLAGLAVLGGATAVAWRRRA